MLWGDRLGALWGILTKTAIGNLQKKVTAKIIMAEMAFFNVAGYLIRGEAQVACN